MTFSVDVITADASTLKNRGLAYAFTSSPYMITAFAASKASDDFYYNVSWRWGFGCFAIIFPVVAAPLFVILKWNLRKATRQGDLHRERSGRTWLQKIYFYAIEFDGKVNAPAVEKFVITDLLYSNWSNPFLRRPYNLSTSIHYRRFRAQWLVVWLYYRNACRRIRTSLSFRPI